MILDGLSRAWEGKEKTYIESIGTRPIGESLLHSIPVSANRSIALINNCEQDNI